MEPNKLQVIIIGGSGLIGKALYQELKDDYNVIITGRNAEHLKGIVKDAPFINWQKNPDTLQHYLEKSDIIINLAGESIVNQKWTERGKEAILVSRTSVIQQFYNIVSNGRHYPQLWIQGSGIGYYGNTSYPTNEASSKGEGFLADLSEAMETEASKFEKLGTRVCSIRTGIVLAKQGGALQNMVKGFRFHMGGHLGNGDAFFPWIHIEDEVRAIRHIMETPGLNGPVNLCAPEQISGRTFFKAIAKAMKSISWLHTPAFALSMIFGKQFAQEVLLNGQCSIPEKLIDSGFKFKHKNAEIALKHILRRKPNQ